MPKIGKFTPRSKMPCDRCNSKRKIAKTWSEKIKNPNGFMLIQHTQLICTNKQCQSAFDKVIADDAMKREKLKLAKAGKTA